ncbi:MAG TPA: ATP-dependent DNA helicase, partial [Actinomycetota bacterium]
MTPSPHPDEQPFAGAPPEVVSAMGGREPTVQQWRAISHPLSPCVVVAGAGSGKTAVMAARVVYLSLVGLGRIEADHRGASPSEILCLTFTNKAAEELSRRVRAATEGLGLPEGEEATVLTYHAFAARLLHDYGLHLGLEPQQRLLTEAQRWQLATALLDDMEFEHVEVRSDYVVGQALAMADQCSNHLVEPRDVIAYDEALLARGEIKGAKGDDRKVLQTAQQRIEICRLAQAFQDRKRQIGAMDYGDQIAEACRLIESHPDVAEEFRARYPVVLLDEYQDTNVAQARLLQALCGRGYPVFAVGDPDQNIYAWRGASLGNLLRFLEDFGQSGPGPQLPLYVNFRSGSRILDVANEVIGPVPAERRAADKELRPHASRGEGRVRSFVASDSHAEGRQIAALIKEEVAGGEGAPVWKDFAILCRKSRLFDPIAEALSEAEIPVEIVDLGGLLQMPEVVDAVAWLRLLNDPGHNVSLARILQGPRWRIGYRDLGAIARWSAARTWKLRNELPGEDDMPGDVVFALVEGLDALEREEIEGLSADARERLGEFARVLERVRSRAAGTLGDLVSAILEESGLMAELEASAHLTAVGSRRNLLNFVQHVSAFSPVEGEASLPALIRYLDTAEEREGELERAQPSEENTVKMLTIHKAKGLEWDVVFVPGLVEHRLGTSAIFPDVSRQANPAMQKQTMPFELRGDRDILPAYAGDIGRFRQDLQDRGLEEERRLCYVASTRARETLVASAAHWYEGPSAPHAPGAFYRAVADYPETEVLAEATCPEESPLLEIRAARAATWPGAGKADDTDALFPEGWHEAATAGAADPAWARARAEGLGASALGEFGKRLEAHRERAALIKERTAGEVSVPTPSTVSATSVADYLRCPKYFYWSVVRPLPRRPSPKARLGSEIHRWIELQGRGQTSLDLDDLPDLSIEEREGDEPSDAERLRRAFKDSRFADRVPLFTERPFLLWVDGVTVRGRIDAVFGDPDGKWEIVDYKTGRVPDDDPLSG